MKNRPEVIGIASGKGGVGKTTVSVNLAVALAQAGKRVTLFDADMGLANAQIALGQRVSHHFGHVLAGEKTLAEILVKTPQGVQLIPGGSGVAELASLDTMASGGIVAAFADLQDLTDVLIVDSAAGISNQVITFMRAVDRKLIVIKDDPSSIADAYGIIKVLAQEGVNDDIYLLPNMMESEAGGQLLHKRLNEVVGRFLGLDLGFLGSVGADELVLQALRGQKSVLEHAPGAKASRDFRRLAQAIIDLPLKQGASGGLSFFQA